MQRRSQPDPLLVVLLAFFLVILIGIVCEEVAEANPPTTSTSVERDTRLRAVLARYKAAVLSCEAKAASDLKRAATASRRDKRTILIKLDSCRKDNSALSRRKCPSCLAPWIVAGVALVVGTAAFAVGVYMATRPTPRLE